MPHRYGQPVPGAQQPSYQHDASLLLAFDSRGHPEGIRRASGGYPVGIRWVNRVFPAAFKWLSIASAAAPTAFDSIRAAAIQTGWRLRQWRIGASSFCWSLAGSLVSLIARLEGPRWKRMASEPGI